MSKDKAFKTGYVAIVGEPNVGKSTLLNSLLGMKLSIVTKKPQTTRQRVLGILNREDAQIIFLDTPGLITPKYLLHEKMVGQAQMALSEADLILCLTEVSRKTELPEEVHKLVFERHAGKPILLVINKVDTVNKPDLLPLIDAFSKETALKEIIPVSALKKDNLADLVTTILKYIPVHPPLYATDSVSEHPERFFVAEFVREKVFELYRDEIPYSTAVEIVEYKEREQGKTFISAEIVVEKDSQKGILIGKGGDALKKVGLRARFEIETFLGRQVFLELRVKVREGWRDKEAMLQKFGYGVKQ